MNFTQKSLNRILSMKRTSFYSAAVIVVGSLGYAGFVYEAKPPRDQRMFAMALLSQAGLFEQALDNARELVNTDESDWEAMLWCAYLEESLGYPNMAYDSYRDALPYLEDDADLKWSAEVSMVSSCMKAGRPRTAKGYLKHMVEEVPQDVVARVLLALSYYALQDDSAFLEEYARAYAIDPHHAIFTKASASVLAAGADQIRFNSGALGHAGLLGF